MARWTTADIPDQTGRTAVVTGANAGLGYATAAALANAGATVVLAVRNTEKGDHAADRITAAYPAAQVVVQELDLTSLDSVRAAATHLASAYAGIDLLINNAGVMCTPKSHTEDGFELQFGTNHLGHFALTGLLMDRLLAVAGSRVVTVSSFAHRFRATINFDDLQSERAYSSIGAYGQSKLANLLFTYELQRRLLGTRTIAVAAHPGGSDTDLFQEMPRVMRAPLSILSPLVFQDAEMGALPTLRAATDPGVLGGEYYGPDGIGQVRGHPKLVASSDDSHDVEVQRGLWTVSEELTGVTFDDVVPTPGPRRVRG